MIKRIYALFAIAAVLALASQAYSQESNAVAGQSQTQVVNTSGPNLASGVANAEQGQLQTQVSQGGHGGQGGSLSISGSFNGSRPIRYLPVPATLSIESQAPAIFGTPDYQDKGPDFISMRQLIGVMNAVDLDADVEGSRNIKIITQMMVVPPEKDKDAEPPKHAVTFDINSGDKVNGGFTPIATLTVQVEKARKSNSASLAIAIGKKARELGAKRVVFLTEGSSKVMTSQGFSIGFSYAHSSVGSDPSDTGSVGAGGLGYSKAWGGHQDKIYLTAIVGN